MTREQLEHLIRAAAALTGEDELLVMGTQAVLGQFANAPLAMKTALYADLVPKERPEKAPVIEKALGEGSSFHQVWGYFARGTDPRKAILPAGWQGRLIPILSPGTRGSVGWTLELYDLLVSEYAAGRENARPFAREALQTLADRDTLLRRLAKAGLEEKRRNEIAEKIRADGAG